ncbi:hypothetical protein AAGG74_17835 [Bacillus mexicanus]|uniref:hypothetical protein n=1 Tax=Bacillus mexicanus TaxID=2834415 RepID=UPI003D1CEADA
MNQQQVLREPFNIETHKKTFINYLEVIISKEGAIMYAVPSHQQKLINLACEKLKMSREDLFKACPQEYYLDIMTWLCKITDSVALWNESMLGRANEKQVDAINELIKADLYKGQINK